MNIETSQHHSILGFFIYSLLIIMSTSRYNSKTTKDVNDPPETVLKSNSLRCSLWCIPQFLTRSNIEAWKRFHLFTFVFDKEPGFILSIRSERTELDIHLVRVWHVDVTDPSFSRSSADRCSVSVTGAFFVPFSNLLIFTRKGIWAKINFCGRFLNFMKQVRWDQGN